MSEVCFFQRLTTSGVVGDSGKPIDVCGFGVESGSPVAVPYIKNGTAASSPAAWALGSNLVNQGNVIALTPPVRVPNGCFVSFDNNTNAVTVFFNQVYSG